MVSWSLLKVLWGDIPSLRRSRANLVEKRSELSQYEMTHQKAGETLQQTCIKAGEVNIFLVSTYILQKTL